MNSDEFDTIITDSLEEFYVKQDTNYYSELLECDDPLRLGQIFCFAEVNRSILHDVLDHLGLWAASFDRSLQPKDHFSGVMQAAESAFGESSLVSKYIDLGFRYGLDPELYPIDKRQAIVRWDTITSADDTCWDEQLKSHEEALAAHANAISETMASQCSALLTRIDTDPWVLLLTGFATGLHAGLTQVWVLGTQIASQFLTYASLEGALGE